MSRRALGRKLAPSVISFVVQVLECVGHLVCKKLELGGHELTVQFLLVSWSSLSYSEFAKPDWGMAVSMCPWTHVSRQLFKQSVLIILLQYAGYKGRISLPAPTP